MNILLLGSGGREHTLAWKMKQSSKLGKLFIAPGNAGTAEIGENVPISATDFSALWELVQKEKIDMVVCGPEQPLVEGAADFFEEKGIAFIGPNTNGAQLEGSKDFSKKFMQRHGIPTAAYASFTSGQEVEAMAFIDQQNLPVVVKASGLAAGKGVLICDTHDHAKEVTKEMLSGSSFGEAGTTVVIEEFLDGIEISIFVLTDGKSYKILPSAKDYKRIGEGDTGLNTGGMGAVSPVPFADNAFLAQVEKDIVQKTISGLNADGITYKGFIFIGLMVVNGFPYVLEYNVRMGDPETQVVMPLLDADLLELFEGVRDQNLSEKNIQIKEDTCTTVVLVSGGYPGSYEKGKIIRGIDTIADAMVFQAGTREEAGQVLTHGGRVLAISSLGSDIQKAVSKSLIYAEQIQFEGKYYRKDIGQDLIRLASND